MDIKSSKNDLTEDFLRCLSDHLSSRQDCKGVEYVVNIAGHVVTFQPFRSVYPDRYHRREADKQDVVEHVIEHHFTDTFETSEITSGTYKYILSFDGKKRQWVRVK